MTEYCIVQIAGCCKIRAKIWLKLGKTWEKRKFLPRVVFQESGICDADLSWVGVMEIESEYYVNDGVKKSAKSHIVLHTDTLI